MYGGNSVRYMGHKSGSGAGKHLSGRFLPGAGNPAGMKVDCLQSIFRRGGVKNANFSNRG